MLKSVTLLIICLACVRLNTEPVMQEDSPPQDKNQLIGICEGCEAVFEYGDQTLSSTVTLPDYEDEGQKIHISGTVFKPGGTEPAPGVILYAYHTDQEGEYPKTGKETGWARRHGYIRGWLKTDENGKYEIRTLRPGAYPAGNSPEHIHVIVLEPDGKYYWIEDFLFDNDPNVNDQRRERANPKGGPGFVLTLEGKGQIKKATRDIELGKNIPGYPK